MAAAAIVAIVTSFEVVHATAAAIASFVRLSQKLQPLNEFRSTGLSVYCLDVCRGASAAVGTIATHRRESCDFCCCAGATLLPPLLPELLRPRHPLWRLRATGHQLQLMAILMYDQQTSRPAHIIVPCFQAYNRYGPVEECRVFNTSSCIICSCQRCYSSCVLIIATFLDTEGVSDVV